MSTRVEWEEVIKRLTSHKYKRLWGKLRISYEALEDDEQERMFQDVAFFLVGEYEWRAKYFWDGLGFGCETGLSRLIQLHLVMVSKDNRLTMHDHVKAFGRHLSRSSNTRLWNNEDVKQMLDYQQGLDQIRGLATSLPCLDTRILSKMRKLHKGIKLLQVADDGINTFQQALFFLPANGMIFKFDGINKFQQAPFFLRATENVEH